MKIRRARISESDVIADLFLRSFRSALPEARLAHGDDETRDWYRDHLLPNTETWVAIKDDVITGFISISDDDVEQLYVDPEELSQGIGTKLIEIATRLRPRGLKLWTFQRNSQARSFYEHHDFMAVRFTDGSGNEEHEPDVQYEWRPKFNSEHEN